MKTAIDWATRPEPWCWIGPQFRAEIEGIAEGPKRMPGRADIMRQRRLALGLTATELGIAAGYPRNRAANFVCRCETGSHWVQRVADTLDRLEAESRQP